MKGLDTQLSVVALGLLYAEASGDVSLENRPSAGRADRWRALDGDVWNEACLQKTQRNASDECC